MDSVDYQLDGENKTYSDQVIDVKVMIPRSSIDVVRLDNEVMSGNADIYVRLGHDKSRVNETRTTYNTAGEELLYLVLFKMR